MELALESGAEDVEAEGSAATIFAAAGDFVAVKDALDSAGVEFIQAEIGYVPQNRIKVESKDEAKRVLKLIEDLEDNEDVQNVYANFDIEDAWLEELA